MLQEKSTKCRSDRKVLEQVRASLCIFRRPAPASKVDRAAAVHRRMPLHIRRRDSLHRRERWAVGCIPVQLVDGQKPHAVILGCSDSRCPPELLFDQGLGDLFTVRWATRTTHLTVSCHACRWMQKPVDLTSMAHGEWRGVSSCRQADSLAPATCATIVSLSEWCKAATLASREAARTDAEHYRRPKKSICSGQTLLR